MSQGLKPRFVAARNVRAEALTHLEANFSRSKSSGSSDAA